MAPFLVASCLWPSVLPRVVAGAGTDTRNPSTRSRYYTGNKRGFSYVQLGSRRGILGIFSVTFLQITCTCFPARFLVTIIFQQLSCQLITGRNTKLPTTLRGLQQLVGKMFCGQEKATPTGWCCNNNATTTQSGKTTSVHDHKAFS